LHRAALQFAELKGEYCLIDIPPQNFQTIFQTNLSKTNLQKELIQLLPENLNGFNVTIPYKEEIYKLVSHHSAEAMLTGAVNTVKIEENGSLLGHNTDLLGFKEAFLESFDIDLNNKDAFVIGAGGSAKTVVMALIQMGVQKIYIKARDPQKVNSFIAAIKANITHSKENKYKSSEIISADQNDIDKSDNRVAAIINASPIGLHSETTPTWLEELINKQPANCICFDLVYRKDQSKPIFAQTAIAKNLPTIDGLSMLVHQARFAFQYWTGVDVPAKVLFASLDPKTKDTITNK
jgi:shikimate dehydrogenase